MNRKDILEKVLTYMDLGVAPSEIDVTMGLPMGTTHDLMVDYWRWERDQHGTQDEW